MRRILRLGVIMMLPVAMACVTDPLVDHGPFAHGAPSGASNEEIAGAIARAAGESGWPTHVAGPGLLVASTAVRRHRATIEIGFDARDCWIRYRDSSNLNFHSGEHVRVDQTTGRKTIVRNGPRIHRNYNRWVQRLSVRIAARVPILLDESRRGDASQDVLVADELSKLDELRSRGVLTQEEFERQKTKLLGR